MSFYIFTIISLILLIICILILKTISKIIGYILLFSTIFLIILTGTFYLTYLDILEIQNHSEDTNLIVIKNLDINLLSISFNKDGIKPIKEEDLDKLNKKEYNLLLQNYYKIIFIDLSVLEEQLPEEIQFEDKIIKKEVLFEIINSDNPFNNDSIKNLNLELLDKSLENNNLKEPLNQKMFLLMLTVQSITEPNITKVFKQYKKGNITIYKETITFKVAKFIPTSIFEQIIKEFT